MNIIFPIDIERTPRDMHSSFRLYEKDEYKDSPEIVQEIHAILEIDNRIDIQGNWVGLSCNLWLAPITKHKKATQVIFDNLKLIVIDSTWH